jgi:hypothetical protein
VYPFAAQDGDGGMFECVVPADIADDVELFQEFGHGIASVGG